MPPPTPPMVKDGRMIEGKPGSLHDRQRFGQRLRHAALRHDDANLFHRVAEQQAIFGHLDGGDRRADQLDVVLLEHAELVELHRQVQRRLPADRRQQRIGALALDDLLHRLRRQRLDVGADRRARGRS